MKKFNDEEIQTALDAGENLASADENVALYELLFTELGKAPQSSLPLSFSAVLIRKIKLAQQRRQDIKLNFTVGLLLLVGLGTAYGCLAIFSANTAKQVIQMLNHYKGICLLTFLTLMLFYLGDRTLIQRPKSAVID